MKNRKWEWQRHVFERGMAHWPRPRVQFEIRRDGVGRGHSESDPTNMEDDTLIKTNLSKSC